MTKLFKIIFLSQFLISHLWAQSFDDIKIDKNSIEEGIKLLESTGQITPEMAKAAREDLAKKSDGEIEALKIHAIDRVKSGNIPKFEMPAVSSTTQLPATPSPKEDKVVVPKEASQDQKLREALNFINK